MIKLIDKKTEMAIKKYKRLFKNYIFISYLLKPLKSEVLKKVFIGFQNLKYNFFPIYF